MDASKSFYEYTPAAHFLVSDEDAADFLQSQFTNDLRPFEAGRSTYGLWLDVKGKVIADSVVLCEGDERFRVLSERCAGERIIAHLQRHIIADDVEIEHCASGYAFELSGTGLQAAGWSLPRPQNYVRIDGGLLFSGRNGLYHMQFDSAASRGVVWDRLVAAGLTALTEGERGLCRIAAGIPQVPEEIGASDLPGEGELEHEAISFTKGCYLGQEVVARMHNVGRPQRRLFIVQGEGRVPRPPMALYDRHAKQVGDLRSAHPRAEGWLGVAILKTRFADAGSELHSGAFLMNVMNPLSEGLGND
ncbi:MAG: hypothetical protein ISQ75_05735 [Puniceicoccaceae bacterium]|nr:hypothetical protein [Puniceicoccaceae bacterium]